MFSFTKFLDFITFRSKPDMSKNDFTPNNFIKHRYQSIEVLQKCLKDFKFKPEEWIIKENKNGFEIQLPKVLDEKQREIINKAFETAEKERKDRAAKEDVEE
ncbi:hypothetical protein F5Y04DRAFT_196298 [Hypomontagnella monticulosa]|nr:hypothetical protein F5Y04DRAFT_196298 [Hypomontagnella monticulosa]